MKRRPLTGTFVTSVLNQLLKQFLIDVTSFRLSKSLYSLAVPYEPTNNSGSVFPNVLETRFYQTKFPTHVSYRCFILRFFASFLTFPSMLIPRLLFATSHVITRPVSCYLQKEECGAQLYAHSELPLLLLFLRPQFM